MRWLHQPFRSHGRRLRPWSAILLFTCFHSPPSAAQDDQHGRNASFVPSAMPLVVRSPYLSAWLPGKTRNLNDGWPLFADNGRVLGWAGFALVDDEVYTTMGDAGSPRPSKAQQSGFYMTATSSVFTLIAGPVSLTYTFLSPITPDDLLRQSIPFGYFSVQAASMDGQPHSVKIYADISGEWLWSHTSQPMIWNTTVNGDLVIHKLQLATLSPLTEDSDRIKDGAAYFLSSGPGLTFQSGADSTVRNQFGTNHTLLNTRDTQYRGIDTNWPVFAFCKDMGQVLFSSDLAVFAIGHMRDQVATIDLSRTQTLRPYFTTKYNNIEDVLPFVMSDFSTVAQISRDFDAKVEAGSSDLSGAGVDYASLLYLSARQSLGATELTTLGTGRPMLLVKDMFNTRTVNAVDAVYAMWPLLRYTSPTLAMAALEPILAFQSAKDDSNSCIHDLGLYPVADGVITGSISSIPIAASSSVIIMALDAARASGDNSQLTEYIDLLDSWASYLVDHALYPDSANQYAIDELAVGLKNQTNIALQGILGIGAMAAIADLTGNKTSSEHYESIARKYAQEWEKNAVSIDSLGRPHILLNYGDDSSWSLAYNLYMDKLLKLSLVNDTIYDDQLTCPPEEKYYQSVFQTHGIALDSRSSLAITEWSIWAAAAANSTSFKRQIVAAVRNYAEVIPGDAGAFPDVYDVSTGTPNPIANTAIKVRPHVGGNFAILALDAEIAKSTPASPSEARSSSEHSHAVYPAFLLSLTCCLASLLYLLP